MEWSAADANSYRPFKILDATLIENITQRFEALGSMDEEGVSVADFLFPSLTDPPLIHD